MSGGYLPDAWEMPRRSKKLTQLCEEKENHNWVKTIQIYPVRLALMGVGPSSTLNLRVVCHRHPAGSSFSRFIGSRGQAAE